MSSITKSISADHHSFKPIYPIRYWSDPDDNDDLCVLVAILTFNKIDKLLRFSINIVGGKLLESKVVWPMRSKVNIQLQTV